MNRAVSISIAMGVAMAATSLQATAAPKAKVVIEDPVGDANFINDQGEGDGSFGDFVTPADVSSVTDLISVSFSNDAKNLYITIETEDPPPATQGVGYRVRVNPDGGSYCLLFEAFFPGATNDLTEFKAHLRDTCEGGDAVPLEILGSTITVPRKLHEAFGKGQTLTEPQAQGFIHSGSYPTGVAAPTSDTTKVGTDYKFVR